MAEKKYIVIGSSGHRFVDCVEWDVNPLPNLVDYDFIIINVQSLTDDYLTSVSSDRMEEFRKLLTRFLISDGVLIILSAFRKSVQRPNKYPDSYSNYAWSPVEFITPKEAGTTIDILKNVYPKYFSKFKTWEYYFSMPQACLTREFTEYIGTTSEIKYKFPAEILIKNRYNKMLSGLYSCEVYYEKTRYAHGEGTYFPNKPDRTFGKIILLPLLQDIDYKEALNIFLEDLLGKPQIPLPPEWATQIAMPFIKKIDIEINGISTKIQEHQRKIDELKKEKTEIESYKKLVYADGQELEDIFKKCLADLGAKIEPAKYSNEEYCLVHNNAYYPIEAKGIVKSISLTHLRQLIDYMLKYDEATEKKCKGILLGNPWKDIPVEKRDTAEKPNFPQNVVQRSKDMNISLISSVSFFHVFCRFLENRAIGENILDAIVGSGGVIDFTTIK